MKLGWEHADEVVLQARGRNWTGSTQMIAALDAEK
jgi:hypothetical protein